MGLAACFVLQTVLAMATGWLVQLLGLGMLCLEELRGLGHHLLQHLLVAAAAQAAAAVAPSSLIQAAAVAAPEGALTGPCLAPAAQCMATKERISNPSSLEVPDHAYGMPQHNLLSFVSSFMCISQHQSHIALHKHSLMVSSQLM